MDSITHSSKSISEYVDRVIKTKHELETVSIPELYGVSFDSFQNNAVYDMHGFLGTIGLQIITPKQTILDEYPVIKKVWHWHLYENILKRIYSGQKLEEASSKIGKQSYVNVSSSENNINHISVRYVNDVGNNNGEIDVNNFCIICGNLNNINNYQKIILLESISSICKKDSNAQIYHYDTQK